MAIEETVGTVDSDVGAMVGAAVGAMVGFVVAVVEGTVVGTVVGLEVAVVVTVIVGSVVDFVAREIGSVLSVGCVLVSEDDLQAATEKLRAIINKNANSFFISFL